MRYSEGFKRSLIKKVIEGNGRPSEEVAKEAGVHPATLGRWIQKYRSGTLKEDGGEGIQPFHRNPGEKLHLLLESKTVGPEELGAWLRGHGLHTEHLRLWEQELSTMANGTEQSKRDENNQLRKENKKLKKELARKDKALVEAAVLLTLKKTTKRSSRTTGKPDRRKRSDSYSSLSWRGQSKGCIRTIGLRAFSHRPTNYTELAS